MVHSSRPLGIIPKAIKMDMDKGILIITRSRQGMRLNDPEMIARKFRVNMFAYSDHRKGDRWIDYILAESRMIQWLLRNILKNDLIYVFFNDVHAFFPVIFGKLTGKKVLIHMGGYDGVWIPSLRYGVFDNPFRRLIAIFNAHFCYKLLPVARCLVKGKENQYDKRKMVEGLNHFIHLPEEKIKVIYPSVKIPDDSKFIDNDFKKKENIVLLVAKVVDAQTYEIKSIGFFLDVAREMEKYRFFLIGINEKIVRQIYARPFPDNLTMVPYIPPDEIESYYRKAKVLFIPSLTEGCPNVLLEGMAYGCVPVGSPRGAIPEVIGNTGIVLKHKDVKEACQAIEWAITQGDGRLAYERCKQNFSFDKRKKQIFSMIEEILA